ncbi:LamG-like jellyroll fold domain-containing protein [Kitasatospora cineracea]|uniref:LamG-like jellyroll fold domain-containing protein n=1 Tax=Kitasatospora cineracea TaxID=88074 RepID=UPI0037BC70AB
MTANQVAAADQSHLSAAEASSETERALASAKSTGTQVPIPGLTTEFSETTATPQGHLYQSLHLEQQRMRKDGNWADLDATLVANPDGSYSPRVSPGGLRLSKGGSDQLATLTAPSGEQLSLTSPLPLSAPRVNGDSLTYTVDQDTELKVTATKFGGFTTVLVLKSAAAAANPALKALRFGTRATGVTVSSDSGDNLTAASSGGKVLWQAPAPLMWDSSQAATANAPAARTLTTTADPSDGPAAESSADGPGQGARVARMPVATDSSGITLTPDQDLLTTGTGPWYLDPAWTPTSVGNNLWNWVQSAYPTLSNDNRSGSSSSDYPGIGRCGSYPAGGSCSPASTYHTYYRFDLSALGGAVVNYAQLNLEERYSANWSCTTTYDVTAYRTDDLANNTTWNTQPTRRDYLGARQIGGTGSSGCGGNIPFNYDVTGVVGSRAGGSISFQIATANESDVNAFKRLTTGANLGILYDKYPDVPQNPRTSPITPRTGVPNAPDLESCAGVPESSFGWITSQDLSLSSTVRSPNQGQLTEWANIWDLHTGKSAEGWSGFVSSGNQASYPVPTGFLEDGHSYGWVAKGDDGLLRGSPAPTCHFRVDLTDPTLSLPGSANGPAVTDLTTQFPPAGNGQTTTLHVGQTGTIPFTAADALPAGALPAGLQRSGVAAVHWSFNPCMCDPYVQHAYFTSLPTQLPVTQLPVTPTHWGTNTVYIQAEDNAGNKTQVTPYTFSVLWSPTPLAYGDVSGDGYPDILAAGDDGRLLNYGQGVGFTAAPTAATVGQAPAGSSWKDLRTSHRGTFDAGDNVDALFVHKDPGADGTGGGSELFYYPNNPDQNGTFDLPTKSLGRPDCSQGVNPSCADYGSVGSWATVSQVTPIGSSSSTLKPTDQITQGSGVLVVEKNNLWYYPSLGKMHTNTAGQSTPFGPPTKLTSDGSWGNYDLMVPGNALADGKPALWVRARATSGTVTAGDIYQYALAFGPGTTADGVAYTTVTGLSASPATRLTSGLTVAAFPQIGAVGDLNGDDVPDLWGFVGSTNRITTWVGVTTDRTSKTPVAALSPRDRQWLLNPTAKGTDAAGSMGIAANTVGTVTWSTDAPSGTGLTGSAGLASADGRTGMGALSPNIASPGTTGSYTVSAWAKINNTDDFYTVLSQTAQTRSPFYLQYSKSTGTWAFVGTSADSSATAYYTAAASSPATPGKWTHLVGTYDSTSKTMTLYVNGTYAGSTTVPSTWASTSNLTIGANRYPDGSLDNKTAGNIADVRTYPYTLSIEQVSALYTNS